MIIMKMPLRRVYRIVARLRSYESYRLRQICFYHNYFGNQPQAQIRRAKAAFTTGSRRELLNMISKSRDVVEYCYENGFMFHGTERRAMYRVLDIYEILAKWFWIIIKIYDLKTKKYASNK